VGIEQVVLNFALPETKVACYVVLQGASGLDEMTCTMGVQTKAHGHIGK
jgi:hypothetical protein